MPGCPGPLPRCPPAPRGSGSTAARCPTAPPRQVPIPITPGLDPLSLLTDAADVAAWSNQGLPSDRMSTENATILCNTQRWPLIVDAQLQGIKWIKNKYGEELRTIRLGQRRWVGRCGAAAGSGWTTPPSPATGGTWGSAGQGTHVPIRPGAPKGCSTDGGTQHPRGLCGGCQGAAGGPSGAQRLEGVRPSSPQRAHSPHAAPPSPLGHSYLDTIERAVSEGQTLLIEDIGETVEPVLDHLLGRNTTKKGRSAPPVPGSFTGPEQPLLC